MALLLSGCSLFQSEPVVIKETVPVQVNSYPYKPEGCGQDDASQDACYSIDAQECNHYVQTKEAPVCESRSCAVALVYQCLRNKGWRNVK